MEKLGKLEKRKLASELQAKNLSYLTILLISNHSGRLRVLTLTTSDKALSGGKDIHRSFRPLVMRLRRRWGHFEYIGVREIKGDRQHLHLVFRGEYMEQATISAMWASLHNSLW